MVKFIILITGLIAALVIINRVYTQPNESESEKGIAYATTASSVIKYDESSSPVDPGSSASAQLKIGLKNQSSSRTVSDISRSSKDSPPLTESQLKQMYWRWGMQYTNALPTLLKTETVRNAADIKALYELKRLADSGNVYAKLDYDKYMSLLKSHADAGNVSAQIDYGSQIILRTGEPYARAVSFSEAKKYFIKAAVAGQANAASRISSESIFHAPNDPVEALAWAYIDTKLGSSTSHFLHICAKSTIPCTEATFIKALDLALFYVDLYEFKVN